MFLVSVVFIVRFLRFFSSSPPSPFISIEVGIGVGAASAVVTYTFAGDVITSVATRSFDANGVAGTSSTNTVTLQGNGTSALWAYINTATAVASPLDEADFAHVVAE